MSITTQRILYSLALCVACAACGQAKTSQTPPTQDPKTKETPQPPKSAQAKASPEKTPQKSFKMPKVTDPNPREFKRVLAWARDDRSESMVIHFTTKPDASCTRWQKIWSGKLKPKTDYEKLATSKDIDLEVTVARTLQPDGTFVWNPTLLTAQIHHIFSAVTGLSMRGTKLELDHNAKPKDGVLSGTLTGPLTAKAEDGKIDVRVSGAFEAEFCGVQSTYTQAEKTPKPVPEGLVWTMAGVKQPIQGASLHVDGEKAELVLTTTPHDCSSSLHDSFPGGMVRVDLVGTPRKIQYAFLKGDRFPDNAAGFELPGVEVEVGPENGVKTTPISLKGSNDFAEYKATFEGATTALVCSKSK